MIGGCPGKQWYSWESSTHAPTTPKMQMGIYLHDAITRGWCTYEGGIVDYRNMEVPLRGVVYGVNISGKVDYMDLNVVRELKVSFTDMNLGEVYGYQLKTYQELAGLPIELYKYDPFKDTEPKLVEVDLPTDGEYKERMEIFYEIQQGEFKLKPGPGECSWCWCYSCPKMPKSEELSISPDDAEVDIEYNKVQENLKVLELRKTYLKAKLMARKSWGDYSFTVDNNKYLTKFHKRRHVSYPVPMTVKQDYRKESEIEYPTVKKVYLWTLKEYV